MKIKKQHKYFTYFISMILVFGCSRLNNFKTSSPSLPVHQETNIITPVVTSPLPTETLLPTIETISTCQGKEKHILDFSKSGISGTIIYQNDDSTGLYSIGGTPISGARLLADETQQSVVFGFSPNGKWLAYSPFDSGSDAKFDQLKVVLLSADGERIESILSTIEFEKELQVGHQLIGVSGYSYWINNQMIYGTLYSQNPDQNTSGYFSDLPKVLDPFHGEWNNRFFDLPGRFLSDVVGISPDMSRALYKQQGLSLWDYERNVQLWQDKSLVAPYRALILWSPNSSMAAYANLYDPIDDQPVSLITKDGGFDPILSKVYPVPDFGVRNISWSPDSRYLAIAGLDGESLNILIYDVFLGKYISQCPVAELNDIWPALIWSPDSSHVAISQIDSSILVLDVFSGEILEFTQHGRVFGWSDSFPIAWP